MRKLLLSLMAVIMIMLSSCGNNTEPEAAAEQSYENRFAEYREITEKYKAMLTGSDDEWRKHLADLNRELAAAGCNETIAEINEMLKKIS